jgi:hypothetical protein
VVIDDPNNVEAVCDDPGIGEEAADDVAVGTGEIDTHDFDLVPSPQCQEIGRGLCNASTGPDIENAMVAQIAKGSAEALPLVQGMFVDTEVLGALQGESFIGLAASEL